MKKFRVTIKTTQEWDKVIKAKDEDDVRDVADDNFYNTHYKNFNDRCNN